MNSAKELILRVYKLGERPKGSQMHLDFLQNRTFGIAQKETHYARGVAALIMRRCISANTVMSPGSSNLERFVTA